MTDRSRMSELWTKASKCFSWHVKRLMRLSVSDQ